MKEITIEITDFCPHECPYCSSNTTNDLTKSKFLKIPTIRKTLLKELEKKKIDKFDRINISGGEPLAHPGFYPIYMLCKEYARDVVVYSNLITHRIYNLNIIDGVYLEANVTPTNSTQKIHVLKRVEQGREKTRPEVKFSRNYIEDCACDHIVVVPDGSIKKTPCNKYTGVDEIEDSEEE